MVRISLTCRAACVAALMLASWASGAAVASPPAPAAAADPTQPQASVPPVVHRSAFTRYRPLATPAPVPWREANETVNRIGGWRAYAREAAQPEPAAATPAATPAPTAPATPASTPALPKGHRHAH